ncbi:MAG: IS1595 family transposase [Candidatus Thiodiazotropha sp. (ex Lucinoma aequizonata)]|nr:IS1595 family transposase [Candidatus Thiodiazotropha sp. (ex Lucinoma aequizonata)]
MPKNTIQFQKGLGLHEFLEKNGTDAQCSQALYQLRWPTGFVCPECGNTTGCKLKSRKIYQCHKCHHQTSLTAGTIFHGTKLPLRKWFLAIYLLTQRKKSISALQLSREIGVNYDTAWKLKHKLMQVMMERQRKKKLTGRIEMDDAYIGGEKPGKRGRGSRNKVPFVAAVETTQDGRPLKIHLRRVHGFRSKEIARYAKSSLVSGSTVHTDGLYCFRAVTEAECEHRAVVTGGGRKSAQHSNFKWVNTMLGNVKNSLQGTFHAIREKHVPRYLAEFEYRFNRRFDLPAMIERLLFVALRTPPMPYRFLRMAEVYG